jgi:hypothetical protein
MRYPARRPGNHAGLEAMIGVNIVVILADR